MPFSQTELSFIVVFVRMITYLEAKRISVVAADTRPAFSQFLELQNQEIGEFYDGHWSFKTVKGRSGSSYTYNTALSARVRLS